jgi:hypothetical protein
MSWMDRSPDQSPGQVAGQASRLEGATTTTMDGVMSLETDPGSGGSRSTSLAKREC